VDVFIVDNRHLIDNVKKISNCSGKIRFTVNISQKNNGQGLMPKTFIYDIYNNYDCDLNERRCLPIQNRCRYLCLNCKEFISDQDHINFKCNLLDVTAKLVDKRLTKKQKIVLKKISQIESKMTMSFLVVKLSDELKIGRTTIRVILQTLRDVGLISCGSSVNKGNPVQLTPVGNIVINKLNWNENKMLEMIK